MVLKNTKKSSRARMTTMQNSLNKQMPKAKELGNDHQLALLTKASFELKRKRSEYESQIYTNQDETEDPFIKKETQPKQS